MTKEILSRKYSKHFFTLLFFMIASNTTWAALSLPEAVLRAEDRSVEISKMQAEADEARWKRLEMLSGFLPTLRLNGQYILNKKYQYLDIALTSGSSTISFPQIFPTSAMSLNASLPLFDGFSSIGQYRAASLQEDSEEKKLEWAKFQLKLAVSYRFFQVLAAEELEKVSEQNLTTLQDHLTQAENLKKSGAATAYDVLRVEVQLNEAKSEVLNAQDNVVLAKKNLALAMGNSSEDIDVTGELPTPDDRVKADLKLTSLEDRKDIQALNDHANALDKVDASSGEYLLPKISLEGSYTQYNNRNDRLTDFDNYRSAYTYGIYLTWTLFDGMASISKAQQMHYKKVQAEKDAELAKQKAPVDFEFWKRRYLYSYSLYFAKKSDVEKATESVRLARAGFRAGVRTSSEVLDSELDLFRAKAGVVNAQINSIEALGNIEMSLGRSL